MARQWVARQLEGTSNLAFWRGLLLVQARDLRPETLSENLETVSVEELKAAIDRLSTDAIVHVTGDAN
jgi:hypothetical protein